MMRTGIKEGKKEESSRCYVAGLVGRRKTAGSSSLDSDDCLDTATRRLRRRLRLSRRRMGRASRKPGLQRGGQHRALEWMGHAASPNGGGKAAQSECHPDSPTLTIFTAPRSEANQGAPARVVVAALRSVPENITLRALTAAHPAHPTFQSQMIDIRDTTATQRTHS
jgi:hypothetical protein